MGQCQGQGKARQGMSRPRHAKLPIGSVSRNALNGAMPRHFMPTQAKDTPCQASNSLTFSKCLEWGNAKAKPRQGMSSPRHAKAKTRHAKARQGMPRPRHNMARQNAWQVDALACQSKVCQSNDMPTQSKAIQGKACQGK